MFNLHRRSIAVRSVVYRDCNIQASSNSSIYCIYLGLVYVRKEVKLLAHYSQAILHSTDGDVVAELVCQLHPGHFSFSQKWVHYHENAERNPNPTTPHFICIQFQYLSHLLILFRCHLSHLVINFLINVHFIELNSAAYPF